MKDAVITLISTEYRRNADGALEETEETRDILCSVRSVGRADFFAAAQIGHSLAFVFRTHPANYQGELVLEYEGTRYGITRTYEANPDILEIYAGSEVGQYGSDEGSE